MAKHKHKEQRRELRGWTDCQTGLATCSAAHGGITIIKWCRCGAEKRDESNGNHYATSGWYPSTERRS